LCREREMACDEGVVQKTQAPRAYAACLASLAERGLERDLQRRAEALSLAAWRRRPELVQRVHRILRHKPVLKPAAARVLLSAIGCGLLAASVVLVRCPQLVAFVAAPAPQQLAQADSVEIDRAVIAPVGASASANMSSDFRAVNTKAILPPVHSTPVSSRRAAQPATGTEQAKFSPLEAMSAGRANSWPTAMHGGSANSSAQPDEARQMIVLAAYEVVQTPPQNSQLVSDYDTGSGTEPSSTQNAAASSQSPAGASSKPGAAASQVPVAHLIFRIYPAGTRLGSNDSPASSKPTPQPTVIPFGDGWLVFQL